MAINNSRNLRVRVRAYLPALQARQTTNRAVAAELGCNEQALCRILKELKLEKEPAIDRKAVSDLAKERKKFREQVANDPGISIEEAAKRAGVTTRTMYRYKKP